MANTGRMRWTLVIGACAMLANSGCMGMILPPLPVPPWVPDRMAERLLHKNDNRTPIMPPIPPGFTPKCEDPPDVQAINRAMPRVARGLPGIYEEFRDDLRYVRKPIVDHVDPPRFYPLIGMAQLHHCHWEITVYYTETITSWWPLPFRTVKPRVEVIYMDLDHLHPFVYGADNLREMAPNFMGPEPR